MISIREEVINRSIYDFNDPTKDKVTIKLWESGVVAF